MSPKSIEKLIDRQVNKWKQDTGDKTKRARRGTESPVITISRQYGSGGRRVAELVAEKLNLAYFDRQIIDHIADQAHIDSRIVEALDEHMRSSIETWVEGTLKARHFDRSEYVTHLLRVVKSLAARGGCVILGRGGNFILQNQPNAFHFCITSPIENRIQEIAKKDGVDLLEAGSVVRSIDNQRRALLQRVFHHRPDDPDYYHAMFNSSRVSQSIIVDNIVQIVRAGKKV